MGIKSSEVYETLLMTIKWVAWDTRFPMIMDAIQVDYSGRTKEASNEDKLVTNVAKVPVKYVFRPEVVKSLPKYTFHGEIDRKHPPKSLLLGKELRSSNALKDLFTRGTRHSSENKSLERDRAERKRSRSLFLAHDHSKSNAKLTENFGLPGQYKVSDEHRIDRRNKHTPEAKSRKDQIDIRLRNNLDADRNGDHSRTSDKNTTLSKRRGQYDQHPDKHRYSPEHLKTFQEEYRKNGKLYCSSTEQCEDRHNQIGKKGERKYQHESPVKDGDRQQYQQNEVVNREWSSPPHRSKYSFDTDSQKPQVQPIATKLLSPEEHKYDSGRSLRRVDSPYPCTNHVNHLSPSRDVFVVDVRGKSIQDDSKQTFNASTVNTPHKKCENCGTPHSPSTNYCQDYSAVDTHSANAEDEHRNTKHRYTFEKRNMDGVNSGVSTLLYRSRSLPQLSIHDSGVASGNEQIPGRPASRLVADLRQLLTLKQHYYPEGGWGWVIVVVGVLVQILSHGIHGSAGVLVQQAEIRFGTQVYLQSGQL